MPDVENQEATNSTEETTQETQTDVSTVDVGDMFNEAGVESDVVEGTTPDGETEDNKSEGTEAGDKEPDKGATESKVEDQPVGFKVGELNQYYKDESEREKVLNFLESQKLYNNGHLDPKILTNLMASQTDNVQLRQSIGTMNNQLNAFRQKTETKNEPLTREGIESAYNESKAGINRVYGVLLQARKSSEDSTLHTEIDSVIAQLKDEAESVKKDYEGKKQDLWGIDYAKKMGFKVPENSEGGQSVLMTSDEAKTKSSENVIAAFGRDNVTKEDILGVLAQPKVLDVLHNLAATMFPRKYNTGENEQEVAQSKIDAMNMVLASSPDVASNMVALGQTVQQATGLDEKIAEAKKAGYDEGFAKATAGLNNSGVTPSDNTVEGIGSKATVSQNALVKGMFAEAE